MAGAGQSDENRSAVCVPGCGQIPSKYFLNYNGVKCYGGTPCGLKPVTPRFLSAAHMLNQEREGDGQVQ